MSYNVFPLGFSFSVENKNSAGIKKDMAKKTDKTEYRCVKCGEYLSPENSRDGSTLCFECESNYYKKLEEKNGCHIALFLMCAITNTYFDAFIVPEDFAEYKGDKWLEYCVKLEEKLAEKGKTKDFFAGETDIRKVFGRNLSEKDLGKYLTYESARIEKLEGTEEQRDTWGVEDEYTTEDYNALDRMYNNRVSNFKEQTITDQMDYTLREVAKWQLLADKLRRAHDIKGSTDALKAVDKLLESECLRKKDEKPIEEIRVDALILSLEKAGLMENGQLLSYDETVKVLQDKFIKSKKYDYSLDAADQVVLDIVNTMRGNADLSPIFDLPPEMLLEDEYGEFEKHETEKEKAAKRYAGLTSIQKRKIIKE